MYKILTFFSLFFSCILIPGQNNIKLSNGFFYEGEPFIATNPKDSNNIIAGWMQMNASAKFAIYVSTSLDGGVSWSIPQTLPHKYPWYSSADISIAFDNYNNAYLCYVDFILNTANPDSGEVLFCKSTNKGLTWSTPVKIFDFYDTADHPIDRPWITVDNSGGLLDGTIYINSMSYYKYNLYPHHIWLRYSKDAGNTWSIRKQVDNTSYSCGYNPVPIGVASVGSGSKLYMAYVNYDPGYSTTQLRIFSAVSNDTGSTFQYSLIGQILVPAPPDTNRTLVKYWTIAADPKNSGRAVFLCADNKNNIDRDIWLYRTIDGGNTWSSPLRVNDDLIGNGKYQDLVWATFSPNGTLGIAWRDRRDHGPGVMSYYDIYAALSNDGGMTITPNYKISTDSSSYFFTSCCNSFLGVSMTNHFIDIDWSDRRNGKYEVFFNRSPIGLLSSIENNHIKNQVSIHPNPSKGNATLKLMLSESSIISVKLIDITGRETITFSNKELVKGEHMIDIDLQNISGGIYIVRVDNSKGERLVQTKTVIYK